MKIYINKANENWICDRIREEFYEYNKDIVTENKDEADIIWILAPWLWKGITKKENQKVMTTIHHIVPDKFDLDEFTARDEFTDVYHVPNIHTSSFIKQYTNKPVITIGYWYDPKKWYRTGHKISRERLGIDKNDFVIGSFQRDSEGSDPLKPKLEKGPDIFCDIVEKFQKQMEKSKLNLHIILGGWRREYIISRLKKAGIKYTYKELVDLETLRLMYGSCNMYLITSRYEGGPQALLESLAMNVPVFSTKVGMAEDVLTDYFLIDDPNKFTVPQKDLQNLLTSLDNVTKFNIDNIKHFYISLFKRMIG